MIETEGEKQSVDEEVLFADKKNFKLPAPIQAICA